MKEPLIKFENDLIYGVSYKTSADPPLSFSIGADILRIGAWIRYIMQ